MLAPPAVNVVVEPEHIVALVAVTVGLVFTVTVPVAVLVQEFISVPVTV